MSVVPVFKSVDTCAGEFKSHTPYMYSTYKVNTANQYANEINASSKDKVIILGGGPNKLVKELNLIIAVVMHVFALSASGYETIMINCNPETVSTDFDTSDRLYFEPVTVESVMNIVVSEARNGSLKGLIVQLGGQTPSK